MNFFYSLRVSFLRGLDPFRDSRLHPIITVIYDEDSCSILVIEGRLDQDQEETPADSASPPPFAPQKSLTAPLRLGNYNVATAIFHGSLSANANPSPGDLFELIAHQLRMN